MIAEYRTITDMEKAFYDYDFIKADSDVTTTTTGVWQKIYGRYAWVQLNMESNLFSMLPKAPWRRSGWRVITARTSTDVTGGVAEDGTLPDTVQPTWAQIGTKPKTIAHTFGVSEVQQFLADRSDDDATASLDDVRKYMATEHAYMISKMLGTDVNTLAGNNIESLDRIASSYSEVSDTTIALDAGDADIYGIDRDASASWADAYVDHNSGTDRDLTDELIRTAINTIRESGGNTNLIVTGYDTYSKLQGLYDSQVRYDVLGQTKAQVGVEGVKTAPGIETGINISTLYGIPLLVSQHVPKDTISRIYLLDTTNPEGFDTPRLFMGVAKPTEYFESGIDSANKDPFTTGKLATKGMYRTMGELICKFFAAQGKIRDLK